MKTLALAAALALAAPLPALAGSTWDGLRAELYGERTIEASPALTLDIPYRAKDDREVPVGASVALPPGEAIERLVLVIDENPMPVSAQFDMARETARIDVLMNMRINGPTPVRAIVETDGGRLLMAEGFVKTSGLGACAAPPVTDAEAALATLGDMRMGEPTYAPTPVASDRASLAAQRRARLEISHPSHSGMQMNQITLLYVPAHFVQEVAVATDRGPLFTLTGSISLSENPEIEFSYDAPLAEALEVTVTDTEGEVFEQAFALGDS